MSPHQDYIGPLSVYLSKSAHVPHTFTPADPVDGEQMCADRLNKSRSEDNLSTNNVNQQEGGIIYEEDDVVNHVVEFR